jgi:hypothetical protein
MDIEFRLMEPLMENRWIIRTHPLEISPYLFRKYKMFNEGEQIILKTKFFETVECSYNPKDLLKITDITIEYLDPTGVVVGGLKMIVKGLNFEREHRYSGDNLMMTKLRVIIDKIELIKIPVKGETINPTPISNEEPKK